MNLNDGRKKKNKIVCMEICDDKNRVITIDTMTSKDLDEVVVFFVAFMKRSHTFVKTLEITDEEIAAFGYEYIQPSCFNTTVVARDKTNGNRVVGLLAMTDWCDCFDENGDAAEYKRSHPRKITENEALWHHVFDTAEKRFREMTKYNPKRGECLYALIIGVASGYNLMNFLLFEVDLPRRLDYKYQFGIATHAKTIKALENPKGYVNVFAYEFVWKDFGEDVERSLRLRNIPTAGVHPRLQRIVSIAQSSL